MKTSQGAIAPIAASWSRSSFVFLWRIRTEVCVPLCGWKVSAWRSSEATTRWFLRIHSPNLSYLMTGLEYRRVQLVAFMREFIPDRDAYMLFDGTAMVCNSKNIYKAQRGYNSHGCHDPQINLMYAAAIQDEKLMPVFYKRFPGSIRDFSAYENVRNEMGAKNLFLNHLRS